MNPDLMEVLRQCAFCQQLLQMQNIFSSLVLFGSQLLQYA